MRVGSISVLGLLTVSASMSYAEGEVCVHQLLGQGFYFGGDVGYLAIRSTVSGSLITPASTFHQSAAADGINGGVHGGYVQSFRDRFSLGAEVYWTWNGGKANSNWTSATVNNAYTFKTTNTIGADVLPGYVFMPNIRGYAHLGVIGSKLRTTLSVPTPSTSYGKRVVGMRVGLGMETAVRDNIGVRVDWTYNFYKSWHVSNATNVTYNFRPRSYTGTLGFNYYFDV